MNSNKHPNWWLAYLIIPVMIGLLILVHYEATNDRVEMVLQLLVVILTFGGMAWWVNANSGAIVQEQIDEELHGRQPDWTPMSRAQRRTIRPEIAESVQPDDELEPALHRNY